MLNFLYEAIFTHDTILPSPKYEIKHLQSTYSFALSQGECLTYTIELYFLGLFGIIYNYKNLIVTMMCVEVMYLGIISSFAIVSTFSADPKGQIYAMILTIVAASESAIGLGILVTLFNSTRSLNFNSFQELRG